MKNGFRSWLKELKYFSILSSALFSLFHFSFWYFTIVLFLSCPVLFSSVFFLKFLYFFLHQFFHFYFFSFVSPQFRFFYFSFSLSFLYVPSSILVFPLLFFLSFFLSLSFFLYLDRYFQLFLLWSYLFLIIYNIYIYLHYCHSLHCHSLFHFFNSALWRILIFMLNFTIKWSGKSYFSFFTYSQYSEFFILALTNPY